MYSLDKNIIYGEWIINSSLNYIRPDDLIYMGPVLSIKGL